MVCIETEDIGINLNNGFISHPSVVSYRGTFKKRTRRDTPHPHSFNRGETGVVVEQKSDKENLEQLGNPFELISGRKWDFYPLSN